MRTRGRFLAAFLCFACGMLYGQPFRSSDDVRPMALRDLVIGRAFEVPSSGTLNRGAKVPKPKIISRQEWGSGPTSGTMQPQFPARFTLHHEGSPRPLTPDKDPSLLLRNLQSWGQREKGWPEIPYHFLIDLEGRIYEARDVMYRGDTNTTYSTAGHLLVTMMGNYEIQTVNQKQLDAAADLMAWLADYYNIDPATLRGHMEFASTQCPGKFLYPFVVSGYLEGEIRKRIAHAYGTLVSSD